MRLPRVIARFFTDPLMMEEMRRIDDNFARVAAPTGGVELFACNRDRIPKGYHVCDGRLVSAKDNPVIATIYSPDRDGMIRLPNLVGKVLVGAPADKEPGSFDELSTGGAGTTQTVYVLPCMRGG